MYSDSLSPQEVWSSSVIISQQFVNNKTWICPTGNCSYKVMEIDSATDNWQGFFILELIWVFSLSFFFLNMSSQCNPISPSFHSLILALISISLSKTRLQLTAKNHFPIKILIITLWGHWTDRTRYRQGDNWFSIHLRGSELFSVNHCSVSTPSGSDEHVLRVIRSMRIRRLYFIQFGIKWRCKWFNEILFFPDTNIIIMG